MSSPEGAPDLVLSATMIETGGKQLKEPGLIQLIDKSRDQIEAREMLVLRHGRE